MPEPAERMHHDWRMDRDGLVHDGKSRCRYGWTGHKECSPVVVIAADLYEHILAARASDGLAERVRALADDLDYAGRPFNHDDEPDDYRRGYGTATCAAAAALRALLDGDPTP